jgi:ribosomal protein L37AE/L43A
MSSATRAVPFHCPYCGDEDLRPHGEVHGEWECRSCQRAFKLGFIGILNPSHDSPAPTNDTPGRRDAS